MPDDTITRISLDATIVREGYRAGRRGLTENPYPVGSREALAWHFGLVKGRSKCLRIVARGKRPCD